MADRLAGLLDGAARGRFPPADGGVEVVAGPGTVRGALVAFTAHLVVAADGLAAEEVARQLSGHDFSEWMGPQFVSWLAARVSGRPGSHDVVLAAVGGPGARDRADGLVLAERAGHPRVARSARFRTSQQVFALRDAPGAGVVIVGCGVAGRTEIAVEVDAAARGSGVGRRLIAAALETVDGPVYAQVAPGNAMSLRCFLGCGFTPIGAEILLA